MGRLDRILMPVAFLAPMLQELRGGASHEIAGMCTPAEQTRLKELWERKADTIDREEFVHMYGTCTLLLEQLFVFQDLKTRKRDKALQAFLSYVLHAETLREACARIADFNAFLEERGYPFSTTVSAEVAVFSIEIGPPASTPPPSLIVAISLFLFNLLSWLTGERLNLLHVNLPLSVKGHDNPGIALFQAPVSFDGRRASLAFPAELLGQKMLRTNDELEKDAPYIAYDPLLFCRHAPLDSVASRVRAWLQRHVQAGEALPGSVEVAAHLGLSQRTMYRHLQAEETSYMDLKQSVQQELSFVLLARRELAISEIARRAGFQTVRSFRRAFIKWTGATPSEFRQLKG